MDHLVYLIIHSINFKKKFKKPNEKNIYDRLCSKHGNCFVWSLNVVKFGNGKGIKLSISVDNVDDSNGKQVEITDSICSVFIEF